MAKIQTGLQTFNNGLINSIKAALSGILISEASDKLLAEKMAMVYLLLGLRGKHLPSELEASVIFSYLRTEYGHKTLDELGLAFRLAIKGELDLKPEDVKVYDQFTVLYLSTIMEAYRKWLLKQNQTVPEKKLELPAATEKLTDDEILDYTRKAYQATNNPLLIPKGVWRIVKTRIEFSEAEMAEIRRLASLRVKQLFAKNPVDYKNENEQEWIDRVSKQLAVEKYFLTENK